MKRLFILAATAVFAGCLPAAAFNAALTKQLESLSGTTRFVQACNLEALIKIAADKNGMRPEHAAVDALAAPQIKGDVMEGSGGALRSRDKWYQFSFTCKASSDYLDVQAFDYKMGDAIPKDRWANLNLYE
jgi:hypothetical protein